MLRDFLHVAALFALAPQLAAAAAVVADAAGPQRLLVGLAVHVGQHQHVARLVVLGDDGNQFTLVKIGTIHRQPRAPTQDRPVGGDFTQ